MDALSRLVNDPVMTTLAEAILHFLWQGCLLALILHIVLRSVPRRFAELRYLASLLTLFAMAVMPIATFGYLYTPTSSPALGATGQIVVDTTFHITTSLGVSPNYLSIVSVGWCLGVFFLSAKMLLEIFQVYKLPTQQVQPAGPHLSALFERLVEQLSLERTVRLRLSGVADVPMVVGIFKPVVLLPFTMASGLTPAQLEMLLMHELAHIKRHDFLVNLLQTLVEIMLFFHPVVGWVSKQVRIERECCCDDIAVKFCGNRHAYATALTEAEHLRHDTIPHLAMAATGGDLKHRVLRMLNIHDCSQRAPKRWSGVAVAASVALVSAGFMFSLPFAFEERFKQLAGYGGEEEDITLVAARQELETEMVESDTSEFVASMEPVSTGVPVDTVTAPELSTQEITAQRLGVADAAHDTVINEDADSVEVAALAELRTSEAVTEETFPLPEEQAQTSAQAIVASLVDEPVSQPVERVPAFEDTLIIASIENDVAEDSPAELETFEGDFVSPADVFSEVEVPVVPAPIEAQLVSMIKGTRSEQTFPAYTKKVAPSAIEVTAPQYPRAAIMRHAADEIEVSFIVNAEGEVEQIRFGENTRHYFKKAIRKALEEWRFNPGTINGEITAMKVRKVFSFSEPDRKSLRLTGSRLPRRT